MNSRFGLLGAALASMVLLCAGPVDAQTGGSGGKGKPPVKPAAPANSDVIAIYLEVDALQQIAELELTPAQLDFLANLAKETAEKPRDRKAPKFSAEYRKVLTALHTALKNNDADQADELRDKLDDLADKEEVNWDEDLVKLTDASRKQCVEFLRQLRVSQAMAYLQVVDIEDPIELAEDALHDSQELKGKEWTEARDLAARTIGRIFGGTNAAKSAEHHKKITALLDRAHQMKPADFAKEHKNLLKEVHDIAGKLTPFEMIRNQVTVKLAELLSNPRLAAAIEIRKANPPK